MSIQDILTIAASVLVGTGLFIGGVGYFISAFKKGGRQEKTDVVSSAEQLTQFWKDQAEGYKIMGEKKEQEWNDKFQTLSREVGELRGQLTAEKTQNERLEKIFQNRDPETQEFMKVMLAFAENQNKTNVEIVRVLGEIHVMTKAEHEREFNISAHVTKT